MLNKQAHGQGEDSIPLNDKVNYVDEPQGVYQIDVGAAGRMNADRKHPRISFLITTVTDGNVEYTPYHSTDKGASFQPAASWSISTPKTSSTPAKEWHFAVIADNRSDSTQYRCVLEEIERFEGSKKAKVEFVIAVGDIDPIDRSYRIFSQVFNRP